MGILVRGCVVLVVLASLSSGALRLAAQNVSVPELAAAYLFNFVRFTTWPADVMPPGGSIVVCVSGNDWVADALVQLTRNQRVDGHPLSVRRSSLDRSLDGCHVVYGAALDAARAQELVKAASGRPILTVSDSADFAQRGGVANFFIDDGRMRFAVNPAAAERARLRISSRLLTLAKVVRDGTP
jgi:hypothetical protein